MGKWRGVWKSFVGKKSSSFPDSVTEGEGFAVDDICPFGGTFPFPLPSYQPFRRTLSLQ